MDKRTLGIMGAITSLTAATAIGAEAAPSAPQPVTRAQSYAELLDPIPNAVERLALVNSQTEPDGARLIKAQYVDGPVAHHHHHHHNHYRRHWRRRHHHHHHHHHNNY